MRFNLVNIFYLFYVEKNEISLPAKKPREISFFDFFFVIRKCPNFLQRIISSEDLATKLRISLYRTRWITTLWKSRRAIPGTIISFSFFFASWVCRHNATDDIRYFRFSCPSRFYTLAESGHGYNSRESVVDRANRCGGHALFLSYRSFRVRNQDVKFSCKVQ